MAGVPADVDKSELGIAGPRRRLVLAGEVAAESVGFGVLLLQDQRAPVDEVMAERSTGGFDGIAGAAGSLVLVLPGWVGGEGFAGQPGNDASDHAFPNGVAQFEHPGAVPSAGLTSGAKLRAARAERSPDRRRARGQAGGERHHLWSDVLAVGQWGQGGEK
jgi:hypothetical protein